MHEKGKHSERKEFLRDEGHKNARESSTKKGILKGWRSLKSKGIIHLLLATNQNDSSTIALVLSISFNLGLVLY